MMTATTVMPAATANATTTTAITGTRTMNRTAPAANTAPVSTGPSSSACRHAGCAGAGAGGWLTARSSTPVLIGSSSSVLCLLGVLGDVPEPLVGPGRFQPLEFLLVRRPVNSVGLAGVLGHTRDG